MRQDAIAYIHQTLTPLVPATADWHDAGKDVDVQTQLTQRRPWVKLYMPSEEGDRHPIETYLVTIDCAAIAAETARALADTIRAGLRRDRRNPSAWRRLRVVGLSEGNFYRVQLSFRVQRPAL